VSSGILRKKQGLWLKTSRHFGNRRVVVTLREVLVLCISTTYFIFYLYLRRTTFYLYLRRATDIIHTVREWAYFFQTFTLITDQRLMFDKTHHGKIKYSKVLLWRLKLSELI